MKTLNLLKNLLLIGAVCAQAPKATIYYSCAVENTFALTIDDGPTEKFPELLETLKKLDLVATFYVNCNNLMKDVTGEPTALVKDYLKMAYDAGHEIGSHTYSHACFTETCKLNNPLMLLMDTKEAFTEQIVKNEDYIYNSIGVYPTSYRAPFGDGQSMGFVNDTMLEWLYELGYPYVIHWDIETQDMENSNTSDELAFQMAQQHYNSDVGQKNKLITLQHAIPVTINEIIPWVKNVWMPSHPNMRAVKVSECLGLDPSAMYRTTKGSTTPQQNDVPASNLNNNSTQNQFDLNEEDSSSPVKIWRNILEYIGLCLFSIFIIYF